jgi:hypothetical protein
LIIYNRGSDIIAVIEDPKLRRHYFELLELSVTAAFIISVWHLNLRLRLAEHVARLAEVKEYICNFVTETLRKRLLGILRVLDDIIKTNLTEISCETGTWMELAQDPVRITGLVRLYSRKLFSVSLSYDFKR